MSGTKNLTPEKILAAAEEVVRRHGAAKATVTDVALALGVSHGSIYRFFPTKVALREAVVAVWLGRVADAQAALRLEGPALRRLHDWFVAFHRLKRDQRASDPELFEAFRQLSLEAKSSVMAYKDRLILQLADLITLGVQNTEIDAPDPAGLGRVLLNALTRFHHPALCEAWDDPQILQDLDQVWAILVHGISSPRIRP